MQMKSILLICLKKCEAKFWEILIHRYMKSLGDLHGKHKNCSARCKKFSPSYHRSCGGRSKFMVSHWISLSLGGGYAESRYTQRNTWVLTWQFREFLKANPYHNSHDNGCWWELAITWRLTQVFSICNHPSRDNCKHSDLKNHCVEILKG